MIEDALREALARREQAPPRERFKMETCGGSGLQPGVDLGSNAQLLDLMEGID